MMTLLIPLYILFHIYTDFDFDKVENSKFDLEILMLLYFHIFSYFALNREEDLNRRFADVEKTFLLSDP